MPHSRLPNGNAQDLLAALNQHSTLAEKLKGVERAVCRDIPSVQRLSLVLYDEAADLLHPFAPTEWSAPRSIPTPGQLSTLPRLLALAETGIAGMVGRSTKTASAQREYAIPLLWDGRFLGFIFLALAGAARFDPASGHLLDVYGHLVATAVANHLATVHAVDVVVQEADQLVHFRDGDTGSHMDRVANYAQLIAQAMATSLGLDADYIERIFLFTRLHDIGKIAMPDSVLLKSGKLSGDDIDIVKMHPVKGRRIIDDIVAKAGLAEHDELTILRNIVEHHHEALDGSGYPHGLRGEAIPLEARITAVADVFDALTSRRAYKEPWSNNDALAYLRSAAGIKLDPGCVEVFAGQLPAVEQIQGRAG